MSTVNDDANVAAILNDKKTFKSYYNYVFNFPKKTKINTVDYLRIKDKLKLAYLQQHLDFDSFNITTNLSIDFIKIFYPVNVFTRSAARRFVQGHFSGVHSVGKSSNMFRAYVDINGTRYWVFIVYVNANNFYKGLSIRLIHPDIHLINYIQSVFGMSYSLTSVEYSLDVSSADNLRLLKIISCTMHQKHSRSSVNKMYNTTFYCSNPRTSTTLGSYVYHKKSKLNDFIRIECRYKSTFFKKLKIKRMIDACSISPGVVFDKIDFKLFNIKRFMKKFLRMMSVASGDDVDKAKSFEEYFFENFNERQGGGILSVSTMLKQMMRNCHMYFDEYPLGAYLKSKIVGQTFL